MRISNLSWVIALSFVVAMPSYGQIPSISIQGRRDAHGRVVYSTYLAGKISVKSDIVAGGYHDFSFAPLHPVKKGDSLAAKMSAHEGYSSTTVELSDASFTTSKTYSFPILAIVNDRSVWPAKLWINVEMKAGSVIHSSGYEIKLTKSVKPGDEIPILCVGNESLLSIWAESGATPWFVAVKDGVPASDRSADIEAWLSVKNYVNGYVAK